MEERVKEVKRVSARAAWAPALALSTGMWLGPAPAAPAADASGESGAGIYTLQACIDRALELNPAAINARHDVQIAEETVREAWGLVLPNVSADGAYTRLDEVESVQFGDSAFKLGAEDTYSGGVKASQLLYSGGKASAALRAGELERRRVLWQRLRVESEVMRDVRIRFAGILLAGRTVDVRRESLSNLRELQRQMEDRLNAGKAAEYDVIAARVRVANEVPRLDAASNALELAVSDFRRLIALDEGPFSARGELALTPVTNDLAAWLAAARDGSPVLHELAAMVALRSQDVDYTGSAAYPELRAFGNYRGANSYGFASGGDNWEWHWTAGLTMNWDIWDGGATRAAVRGRELEVAKARNRLSEGRRAVELEVRRAWLDMELAGRTAAAGQENIALARKGLAIAEQRTKVGLATYLDYLYAQLALSESSLTYYAALHDHMNAVTQLEHAGGVLAAGRERSHE